MRELVRFRVRGRMRNKNRQNGRREEKSLLPSGVFESKRYSLFVWRDGDLSDRVREDDEIFSNSYVQ